MCNCTENCKSYLLIKLNTAVTYLSLSIHDQTCDQVNKQIFVYDSLNAPRGEYLDSLIPIIKPMYPINDSFVANKFYLLKRGTFIDFLEKYNQNTMQAN